MVGDDLRVLAMLTSWWGTHWLWVNADRLTRIVSVHQHPRVRAFWSAAACWMGRDRRFSRMQSAYRGPRVDLLATGTEFQIKRHGEDPRFRGTCLHAPANVLRDRPSDVLPPAALSQRHSAYRCRVIIGPSYRADMWAALETDPELSPTELARQTYGSFATAWQVKRDFVLVNQDIEAA
jgi:hypothetical protein